MKVLVCGAGGQLGTELQRYAPAGVELRAMPRVQLDICDRSAVHNVMAEIEPDTVINAAAYTDVERAEREPDLAFRINADAVGILARECRCTGSRFIHVSTDYVFDGCRSVPYQPGDATHPLNTYGRSKLEGEKLALGESAGRALVVRSAWVYASTGKNFVMKLLERMQAGSPLRVVHDQIGTPTWAGSLAQAIWSLTKHNEAAGLIHYTDAGKASWFDLASALMQEALELQLIPGPVDMEAIESSQYPTTAVRPMYSVLDISAAEQIMGSHARPWREALRMMLKGLRAA